MNKAIIILHEIYGINKHISGVCEKYASAGYDVCCPELTGKVFGYHEEKEAYSYFHSHAGLDPSKIIELLGAVRTKYDKIAVLGFSVGAAIAWRCAESGLCDAVISIYGSRIRDYTDLVPKCPSLLIFASDEPSFPASEAERLLENKASTVIIEGNHGFSDPYSPSYNPASAAAAEKECDIFLTNAGIL